ncbi:MAG: hypothetical protein GXP16_00910 [Gammaproteobacteria bacterium]|nr:hypothetical protein [Gammaproteobacteria bacterium]
MTKKRARMQAIETGGLLMAEVNDITQELHKEIDAVPEADRALLLRLVKSYREGVCDEDLPTAEESFREGWQDVLDDNTHPVEDLWDRVNEG